MSRSTDLLSRAVLIAALLVPLATGPMVPAAPGTGAPSPHAPGSLGSPDAGRLPLEARPLPDGSGVSSRAPGVADGIIATIDVWPPTPEIGHPLYLNVSITGGAAPYAATWIVDWNLTYSLLGPDLGLVLRPTGLAPINVTVEVADQYQRFGTDTRTVNLTPPPNLSAVPLRSTGDPDRPFPLNITITGGAGPYDLAWQLLPNGSVGSTNVVAPGSFLQPVVPESAGPLLIRFVLTDALRSVAAATYSFGPIGFPLGVVLAPAPAVVEAGSLLSLTLEISGGTPPYQWEVDPSSAVGGVGSGTGSLEQAGAVRWDATPIGAGNLTVSARALDAVGAEVSTAVGTEVVSALTVWFDLSNSTESGRSVLTIQALVAGGVPPYVLSARAGPNASTALNMSAPGSALLRLVDPGRGRVPVELAVEDSRGGNFSASAIAYVAAPPSPPALPAPSPETGEPLLGPVIGGLVLIGAVAGLLAWMHWGRERPAVPSAALDGERARATVARVLSEAEELELDNLLLQLDVEGIPSGLARTAIAELEQLGRIQRGAGADGEELLGWVPPPPPSMAPPVPTSEAP